MPIILIDHQCIFLKCFCVSMTDEVNDQFDTSMFTSE